MSKLKHYVRTKTIVGKEYDPDNDHALSLKREVVIYGIDEDGKGEPIHSRNITADEVCDIIKSHARNYKDFNYNPQITVE